MSEARKSANILFWRLGEWAQGRGAMACDACARIDCMRVYPPLIFVGCPCWCHR